MDVNFFGTVALTKAFLPYLRASQGRIINHSSIAGILATPLSSVYSASKFAVDGFSDGLRRELLPLGVSVSILNTAFVRTPLTEAGDWTATVDAKWKTIYSQAFKKRSEGRDKYMAKASTTDETDAVVLHALTAARPASRYFPANVMGIPCVVLAVLARVIPTPIIDALLVR